MKELVAEYVREGMRAAHRQRLKYLDIATPRRSGAS
jgi:hypothetical protein